MFKNGLSIVRRVVNLAIRDGLLERDRNPAAHLAGILRQLEGREASEVRRIDAWTREEVATILGLARERAPRYYPILVFLFQTGARRGEARAFNGRTWTSRVTGSTSVARE